MPPTAGAYSSRFLFTALVPLIQGLALAPVARVTARGGGGWLCEHQRRARVALYHPDGRRSSDHAAQRDAGRVGDGQMSPSAHRGRAGPALDLLARVLRDPNGEGRVDRDLKDIVDARCGGQAHIAVGGECRDHIVTRQHRNRLV